MSNRIDIPLILLVIGLFSAPISLFVKSSGSAPFLPLVILVVAMFAYAAYWGLMIRRGLAVPVYRNQAFGITLVSVGYIVQLIGNYLSLTTFASNPIISSNAAFGLRYTLVLLLTFYWIDASMRASQDTDPLSRDTLLWSKVRYVLWSINVTIPAIFIGFLLLTGNYQLTDSISGGLLVDVIGTLSVVPLVVTFVSGIVSLPFAAARSKDRNLRRQIEWFALSNLFLFLVLNVLPGLLPNNSVAQGMSQFLGLLLGGYCLYRSALALVPLNRRVVEATVK